MFYQLYELNHAAMAPFRAAADIMRFAYANPLNPFAQTPVRPHDRGKPRNVRAHDTPLRKA